MDKGKDSFNKEDFGFILNKAFECSLESIFVADSNGVVIKATEEASAQCGVKKDYFLGKTTFEIEKKGIFYPSVTSMVIKSLQKEIVLQKTKTGKTFLAVGVPILKADGRLSKVISISLNVSDRVEIAEQYAEIICEVKDPHFSFSFPFVCCSPFTLEALYIAKLAAETTSTVLISGESGTGKDLIARAIHEMSQNREGPFIKVNSVAVPESLFESEYFGYNPGAFTGANKEVKTGLFEAAQGGTIFLDEISELSLIQQAKLLQVLQDKTITRVGSTEPIKIDLRLISATNTDIFELVSQGKFREDLYYRLNVIPINLPPLRERKEEIPLLINLFLNKYNSKFKYNKQISDDTIHQMMSYHWPGNIRELENFVERLLVTTKEPLIDLKSLPDHMCKISICDREPVSVKTSTGLKEAVQEIEKKTIALALNKYGSTNKAAKALNINQSTLSRKIKKYNLSLLEPLKTVDQFTR